MSVILFEMLYLKSTRLIIVDYIVEIYQLRNIKRGQINI